jgi:hypothetical protein
MQQYPNNRLFETAKCIIYAGLTDLEVKLLAWDHNRYNECIMFMNFIQRMRFIHNEFYEICHGERSNVDVKFQKKCCMEIRFHLMMKTQKKKIAKEVIYLEPWIAIFN